MLGQSISHYRIVEKLGGGGIVNRADIRMVERGRGLRFALKAGQRLRVAGDFTGQELECDETTLGSKMARHLSPWSSWTAKR